jgi:hypothetical protein
MRRLLIIGVALLLSPAVYAADDPETEIPIEQNELVFKGYTGALPFNVAKERRRTPRCLRCHATMDTNFSPRQLEDAPHTDRISHGEGKFWCLACHDAKQREKLRTMVGETVEFDKAYIICGACHSNRQKDWYFGVHGKRQANWQGERVIYNCTHCHDPHEPGITARKPKAPPPVRAGLKKTGNLSHIHSGGWRERLVGQEDTGSDE